MYKVIKQSTFGWLITLFTKTILGFLVDFTLISQLGEQHYSQSGNLVQSGILMTQIGNCKSYLVSRVDTCLI